MNITLYMLYNCYIMLYMLYNRYITYITVICPSLIHPYNVPPDTGQNPQNLQDTQGTMARNIW